MHAIFLDVLDVIFVVLVAHLAIRVILLGHWHSYRVVVKRRHVLVSLTKSKEFVLCVQSLLLFDPSGVFQSVFVLVLGHAWSPALRYIHMQLVLLEDLFLNFRL